MALAYTAPTWTDGSGEGISASNLQAISDCIQGLVQGSDKAIHSFTFVNSVFTITYADGTQETVTATGMKGVSQIEKTGTAGNVDTYTITYTDGTTSTFTVTNGTDGSTPVITATATADATSSPTPSVVVTKTGTDAAPSFAFAFSGLKGEQGPQGPEGPEGPAGSGSVVTVGHSGTASATGVKKQVITVDDVPSEVDGSVYMETDTKTTASSVDTFSFSNAAITTSAAYDIYADVYGVVPSDVVVSSGSLQVKFNSSDNVTKVRVYIR